MAFNTATMRDWPGVLILDLDGTLVDSTADIASAFNRAVGDGGPRLDAESARRHVGDGARKLLERAFAEAGHAPDARTLGELTTRFASAYRARPWSESVLYDGVDAALARVRARGVRIAVCTNKPKQIADQVIRDSGLHTRVDVVVGAGDVPLKPDPAPLRACLDALETRAADALYIGDMAVDRDAARAAGLPVLLAAFGYSPVPVDTLKPDGVLAHWDSLEHAVDGVPSRR